MVRRKQNAASRRRESSGAGVSERKSGEHPDIAKLVSSNLKKLRTQRGLTLEALANKSGVSRGMLSQIELGRSVPTISLLWKVADALGARFAELTGARPAAGTTIFKGDKAKMLISPDGGFTSRALFPYNPERRVEFYKITLTPRSVEASDPHPPETIENLIVAEGKMELVVEGESYRLKKDDAIWFEADVPHKYINLGATPVVMYVVLIYADSDGRL